MGVDADLLIGICPYHTRRQSKIIHTVANIPQQRYLSLVIYYYFGKSYLAKGKLKQRNVIDEGSGKI